MDKYNFRNLFTLVLLFVLFATSEGKTHHIVTRSTECVLPNKPDNGKYHVIHSDVSPGHSIAFLNVTCDPGYTITGESTIFCSNGNWNSKMPKCLLSCRLPNEPSVRYRCYDSSGNSLDGTRDCGLWVPVGTTVIPQCREAYYHEGVLQEMNCVNGAWDYQASCTAECGRISQEGYYKGQALPETLPWHVTIYDARNKVHEPICGGSIITRTEVITAAHCFKKSPTIKFDPTLLYIVKAAKYKWDNSHRSPYEQKFQVKIKDVQIPTSYQGRLSNFKEDIAVLKLDRALEFNPYVMPVCLDFNSDFYQKQVFDGNGAKLAAWSGQNLQILDYSLLEEDKCLKKVPEEFRAYVTSDKMCAQSSSGTPLCRVNTGTGLSVPETKHGVIRYYLRGLLSIIPEGGDDCPASTLATFTDIQEYKGFIRQNAQISSSSHTFISLYTILICIFIYSF